VKPILEALGKEIEKEDFQEEFKFNNLLRLYKLIFKTIDNFKTFLSLKLFVLK
jgi:hypothetical protein